MNRSGTNTISRRAFIRYSAAGPVAAALTRCGTDNDSRKPNIVYIMADDLGYGEPECYGGTMIRTPNIDRMAAEGMRFTSHYAGSTVCAPSRSCLMTGLHTGHTPIRGNREVQPEGQHPLPAGTMTVGKLLQQAGYVTGAVGKWGLGAPGTAGVPNAQGFDYFYGYNCQRQAHSFYPDHLWENDQRVPLDGNTYTHNLLTDHALEFIRTHRDRPFFLYLPYTIPHGRYEVPDDRPYSDKDWPAPMRKYASMIHRLDRDVGRVLDLLRELDLEKQTLVIFTSDNGPERYYEKELPEFFNSAGPLRGIKRDLYDGGIRVPFIARWPGTIRAGSTTDHVAAFWDFLPTCADLAGVTTPADIDGISYLPTLLDREQPAHAYLYWEFHRRGTMQAVRMGRWKAVRLDPAQPLELYDIQADIGESRDLADQQPELVKQFEAIFASARTESEIWPLSTDR